MLKFAAKLLEKYQISQNLKKLTRNWEDFVKYCLFEHFNDMH